MIDMGKDGMNEVIQMQSIVRSLKSDTRLFVASIRSASQLAELAAKGCDTFTFSPQTADGLFYEEATVSAAKDFEMAALKSLSFK